MRKIFWIIAGITSIGLMQPAITHAHEGEHVHVADTDSSDKPVQGMSIVKKYIDGYSVSFHVTKATEDMQHGGIYNLMIKVEKDGRVLTDLLVNSKVSHPIKESESKMMVRMGDWYMAGYDLGHPGVHQIMVLFKTSDGKKHFGGITFQAMEAGK